jgi:sigma-B regulation protein RsbU (phosphoserine phosphatase)
MEHHSRLSAEITVVTPLATPAHYTFHDEVVSIGRASECTIPIKDRYLSRKHAEIDPAPGNWVLRDCGSANGTYLNGSRVESESPLRSGDRIRVGDTEIVFHCEPRTDRMLAIAESKITPTISIPALDDDGFIEPSRKSYDRLRILNALAGELIEDQPYHRLFGFILDRVMEHLKPSRAAIGLLAEKGLNLVKVEVKRRDADDHSELGISRTLLAEVVEKKRALAFMDVSVDEKLSRAKSIILQGIHSVLCAPLLINDNVVGVLYVDFLFNQRDISEEDVRLVAQIARFAAVKLENARLREEAIQKRLLDEELKTAYVIQRRLLPETPPEVPGYTMAGMNRPCRTVSGDYYDFVVRPDGRIYFVIADVSGKGVTAGLVMAGLQASFRIFTKNDPSPALLVEQLNVAIKQGLPESKFVTLFAGRLDPTTGEVEFTNAGHNPPLHSKAGETRELSETELLLGLFQHAKYTDQRLTLEPGDALVLFTDGFSEAENSQGEVLGSAGIQSLLRKMHGRTAADITAALEQHVIDFVCSSELSDDLTLLVISRGEG